MKVLVSAYSCDPGRGSEPGIGWNWAKQIARFHKVWVITRPSNRPVIEAELKKNPIDNLNFEYYDLPNWAKFWKKGARGIRLHHQLFKPIFHFASTRLEKLQAPDSIKPMFSANTLERLKTEWEAALGGNDIVIAISPDTRTADAGRATP